MTGGAFVLHPVYETAVRNLTVAPFPVENNEAFCNACEMSEVVIELVLSRRGVVGNLPTFIAHSGKVFDEIMSDCTA